MLHAKHQNVLTQAQLKGATWAQSTSTAAPARWLPFASTWDNMQHATTNKKTAAS
jgi:hypothetical protein